MWYNFGALEKRWCQECHTYDQEYYTQRIKDEDELKNEDYLKNEDNDNLKNEDNDDLKNEDDLKN